MSLARDIADLASVTTRLDTVGGSSGALSNRNIIINGAMQVAQRGTSSTGVGGSDGYFTCDRWNFAQATNAGRLTMTKDSSAPAGFANSLKLACTTADTSIGADEAALLQHKIEGQNLQRFAKGTSGAKQFTLSFYVKGNASATYTAELYDSDNQRANGKTFSVTTDWTRIEITYPADTTGAFDNDNAVSLDLNIWLHAGTTYTGGTFTNGTWTSTSSSSNVRVGSGTSFFDSTSRTFFITGVQLEVGDTATDFEHRTFGDEVVRCQRYFNYTRHGGTSSNAGLSNSYGMYLPQAPMRANPTATAVGNDPLTAANFTAYPGGASVSVTINAIFESENGNISVRPYVTGNNTYTYMEGFISLDAEL